MDGELRDKTIAFVKETLEGAEAGHDWSHVERVRKLALHIREMEEKGDPEVIELSALLHDIADPKFHDGDGELGGQLAYNFLTREGLPADRAEHIRTIIKYISFKGGIPQDRIRSIEFQIVQDADRLDAMGAIGIARAFNYGGFRNMALYDLSVPVRSYRTEKEYRESRSPTLNHFYEKLLKLRDLMNTPTGRILAGERHQYMVDFLEQFRKETGFLPEGS